MKSFLYLTQLLIIVAFTNCGNNSEYKVLKYDCNQTASMRLFQSGKLLFVFPNDDDSLKYKEQTSFWIMNLSEHGIECTIKYEDQLIEEDFKNPMFIFGVIYSFNKWDMFSTPIIKLDNGFKLGDYTFTDTSDAILYIPDSTLKTMKFVAVGNSIYSMKPITNNMQDGYNYLVYEDEMITHFGNTTNNAFDEEKHVYLPEIKKSHYKKVRTKYYDFWISQRLDSLIKSSTPKLDSFDLFVDKYIDIMKLDKPNDRIKCFIHFDNEEISYVSTHFDHLCGGTTYGIVTGNEIHSLGFDGAIEHESSHIIFNSQFNNYAPTFFSEGIRQYYEFATDPDILHDGISTAKQYIEEDVSPVMKGEQFFFQGNKYYYISGVFVTYLVDVGGLDTFKEFYSKINTPSSIKENLLEGYSMDLETCLDDYKAWLKEQ